jgi:hypothetical protein
LLITYSFHGQIPVMFLRFNITLLIFLLTSCASESLVQSEQEINMAKQEATNSDKSPESLLLDYENKLSAFGGESLFFYAPLNMRQASVRIEKAKALLNKSIPGTVSDSKFELSSALRLLDKALSIRQSVKLHLKAADTNFTELKNLQTPLLLPAEFIKIKEAFSRLSKQIEIGNIQEAIQQEPDFIKDMLVVEIDTLRQIYLEEATNHIQQAKEIYAEDYAPASLKKAQKLLLSTQAFIEKSYRDRNTISEMSKETLKASKKLYFVTKEAFAFHQSTNEENEKKIINSYDFLRELGTNFVIKPIEIAEYSEQRTELLKQIKLKQQESKAVIENLQTKKELSKPITPQLRPPQTPIKMASPIVIMSQETNKAVLPELFMPNTYSETNETDEEDLEFDSIEIVK